MLFCVHAYGLLWNLFGDAYLQERDPIERIRKLLLSHEIATVAELKVGP